jgi:hypothetical protein
MFQLYEINYKKVRFSRIISIVYIPPKEAIYDIKENLWWSQYDHTNAHNNSFHLIAYRHHYFSYQLMSCC